MINNTLEIGDLVIFDNRTIYKVIKLNKKHAIIQHPSRTDLLEKVPISFDENGRFGGRKYDFCYGDPEIVKKVRENNHLLSLQHKVRNEIKNLQVCNLTREQCVSILAALDYKRNP